MKSLIVSSAKMSQYNLFQLEINILKQNQNTGSKLPDLEPFEKSLSLRLPVPTYHVHHLGGAWESWNAFLWPLGLELWDAQLG